MKAIKLSILAALMLVAGINTAKAQNADDILNKHEKAVGGTENWDKIKTMKMTGTLSVQGMDIAITENMTMNKALRMDFTVMGMGGYQIVTTAGGWMMEPGQNKIDTMKPDVLKEAQKQLDVKTNQLLDYKAKGTWAELLGKDSVDKSLCYKIKLTEKDGSESTSYFDVNTYYLLRTEVKQDDQEQAINYKDYKKLPEGVVMPMSVTASMGEIVFKSIDINKPVDEKLFIPGLVSATTK